MRMGHSSLATSVTDIRVESCSIIDKASRYIKTRDPRIIPELSNYIIDFTKKSSTPIICGEKVLFIYVGEKNLGIEVVGDWNNWGRLYRDKMVELEGKGIYVLQKNFPINARLEYRFVVDGKSILDPFNPRVFRGSIDYNSELRMPGYRESPEIRYYSFTPRGELREEIIYSEILDQERRIHIYIPPFFESTTRYPLLIFNDGSDYIVYGKAINVLNNLLNTGKIKPLIAVFIDPVEREKEYSLDEKYTQFIMRELLPYLEEKYPIAEKGEERCIIGADLAALQSLYIATKYPSFSSKAICQSGLFLPPSIYRELGRPINGDIFKVIESLEKIPIKVHLQWGVYDGINGYSLATFNRKIARLLKEKGAQVSTLEAPEGHSWGFWRSYLGRGLVDIFGEKA